MLKAERGEGYASVDELPSDPPSFYYGQSLRHPLRDTSLQVIDLIEAHLMEAASSHGTAAATAAVEVHWLLRIELLKLLFEVALLHIHQLGPAQATTLKFIRRTHIYELRWLALLDLLGKLLRSQKLYPLSVSGRRTARKQAF